MVREKRSSEAQAERHISAAIAAGLGGRDNIADVDCCATRLRITVIDENKVNDQVLKQSGASGVIHKGNGIQVVYGPQVAVIKSNLVDFMESSESDSLEVISVAVPATDTSAVKKTLEDVVVGAHMNGIAMKMSAVADEAFAVLRDRQA